jgi:hypothetical protein
MVVVEEQEGMSYVYIGRLVKTRDPHPGLLQFAIIVSLLSQSAFPPPPLSLLLSFSSIFILSSLT